MFDVFVKHIKLQEVQYTNYLSKQLIKTYYHNIKITYKKKTKGLHDRPELNLSIDYFVDFFRKMLPSQL